jgi:hypothetical protein
MVMRRAENGAIYHEPPYTPEEKADIHRRTGGTRGPIIVYHGPRSQSQKSPPPSPEEPPQT